MDGRVKEYSNVEDWMTWSGTLAMADNLSLGEDFVTPTSASPVSPAEESCTIAFDCEDETGLTADVPNLPNGAVACTKDESIKSEDEGILIVCSDGESAPLARPDTFSDDERDQVNPKPLLCKTMEIPSENEHPYISRPGSRVGPKVVVPFHHTSGCDGTYGSTPSSPGSPSASYFEEEEDFTDYDMLEFAENHYNVHVVSSGYGAAMLKTLGMVRRRSTSEIVPVQDLVKYTKSTCIPTSHVHLNHPENVDLACNIFRDICRYMRGEVKGDASVVAIRRMISQGIQRVELRDEIFCQLVRQTNCTPTKQAGIRAWTLLLLCCVAFQPSRTLRKYLLSYLRRSQEGATSTMTRLACQCVKYLTKTRHKANRKLPPSIAEIEVSRNAVKQCLPVVCPFHFLDGSAQTIRVGFLDTAENVVQRISKKLGLKDCEGWAVYESTPERDRHVRNTEYLLDVSSEWEERQRHTFAQGTPKKGSPKIPSPNYGKFVFCKRVLRPVPSDLAEKDQLGLHLLFAQAVHHVVQVDDYAVQDSLAIHLAGLQAQVLHGDYNEGDTEKYESVSKYLCERVLTNGDDDWPAVIAYAHKNYASGLSVGECQVKYLTLASQCLLFGCSKFYAHYQGSWEYGSEFVIAVNYVGVKLISVAEKSLAAEITYGDLESVWYDKSVDQIAFILKNSSVSLQKCYMFGCRDCSELVSLLKQYSMEISDVIKEKHKSELEYQLKAAEADCLQLYANIASCRQALVQEGLLRKPEQQGSGIIRSALKRLSGKSTEDVTQTDNHDFKCSHWRFTRLPFKHSLMTLGSRELEDVAMRMFNSTLIYSGLESTSLLNAKDLSVVAQTLIRKCLDSPDLCNEFFLQLVKQTTSPPADMFKVVEKYWFLMAMSCWITKPPHQIIQNYVRHHLQVHAQQKASDEGKIARFCLQGVYRCLKNKNRRCPPSAKEIEYIMCRHQIREFVNMLDGNTFPLEFDSQTTAEEGVELMKCNIGIKPEARGFALFNVTPNGEYPLSPKEKLADCLFDWERFNKEDSILKDCKFLFKKRLFVEPFFNPLDPLEVEVLYHQSVTDVFEGKVPLTKEDAVRLCALTAQADFGDFNDVLHQDYASVMRVLPRTLRDYINTAEIAHVHQSLGGLTTVTADVAFLDVLKNWPLYGATFFSVAQTNMPALPDQLWLAVSQLGVHLMEVRGQTVYYTLTYDSIMQVTPCQRRLTIDTKTPEVNASIEVETTEARQIARLITDYQQTVHETPPLVDYEDVDDDNDDDDEEEQVISSPEGTTSTAEHNIGNAVT